MELIARINLKKIITSFKYNPKYQTQASGVINGIIWSLMKKTQISNDLYRYEFLIIIGGSIGMPRTIITGDDMDIKEIARNLFK
jgi:hypothetical protein